MIIEFNQQKNELLIATRGVSFYDVEEAILKDEIIIVPHLKRNNQNIILFLHQDYVHCCPFVQDENKIFLKTINACRNYKSFYNQLKKLGKKKN